LKLVAPNSEVLLVLLWLVAKPPRTARIAIVAAWATFPVDLKMLAPNIPLEAALTTPVVFVPIAAIVGAAAVSNSDVNLAPTAPNNEVPLAALWLVENPPRWAMPAAALAFPDRPVSFSQAAAHVDWIAVKARAVKRVEVADGASALAVFEDEVFANLAAFRFCALAEADR
jgi:hypothetical protein